MLVFKLLDEFLHWHLPISFFNSSVLCLGLILAVAISILETGLGLPCIVTVCVSGVLEQPNYRKLTCWLALEV